MIPCEHFCFTVRKPKTFHRILSCENKQKTLECYNKNWSLCFSLLSVCVCVYFSEDILFWKIHRDRERGEKLNTFFSIQAVIFIFFSLQDISHILLNFSNLDLKRNVFLLLVMENRDMHEHLLWENNCK